MELTKDIKKEKAFEQYQIIQNALKVQSNINFIVGKALKEIRDEKLYLYLGMGGFDTFNDFLNNPEISIRPSTAYSYIRVYEHYILELEQNTDEMSKIPFNRLVRMIPHTKGDKDEAVELIDKAKELTNVDFDKELVEQGFIIKKPQVFADAKTGKWIVQFNPDTTSKIINSQTKEILYETTQTT